MKRSVRITAFNWDEGNKEKNWERHRVSDEECEEVFFDPHKRILEDAVHSADKERYILLGQTRSTRLLFVVFTLRGNKVRVISARDLNKREKKLYDPKI